MQRIVQGLAVVSALLTGLASGGPVAGLCGPRPFDAYGDDPAARIEWKENWDSTYKSNLARWEAEVRKVAASDEERGLLLRTRVAAMLDALIARYPNEGTRRLDALKEMAGNYYACGLPGHGNYALQRLVGETPGQVDLVAAALHRILVESGEGPGAIEEWPAWVEYAALRLVALNRSGSLADGHVAVVAAWRALAVLRRAQERLLEAAEALDALEVHTGRDDWWQQEEGEQYFAAGREAEALSRFQDLFGRSERHSRARERIHQILAHPPANPPSYAGHFGLETRWDAIRSSPPGDVADRIAQVYRDDAGGGNLLPWKDVRHACLWAQLDRHLLAQPPAALEPLRAAQEAEARRLRIPGSGSRTPQPAMVLSACRRLPWALTAQRLLLGYGEDALRQGHAGLALRAFQDVLAHAADPALRSQAQVGVWLAMGSGAEAPAADGAYPWLGGREQGRAIVERLKGTPPGAAEGDVALSGLARQVLRLPPVGPWQPELVGDQLPSELAEEVWPRLTRPLACPAGVLVAGPEVLAFFGDDPRRPLWVRTRTDLKGKHGRLEVSDSQIVVLPGPFQPAIAGQRVHTRWGLEETRRFLTDVAAFDLRTGEMLWSTAGDPAWGNLWPISDPTAAEGRLYVLALRGGYTGILPVSSVSLVCLDAATGAVVWRRELASQNVTLIPGQMSNYREYQFDLAHYGNAVTVAEGAVYCQTNLGFVARCDARDGQVEWAANYARLTPRWNVPSIVRRQGAAPVIHGDRVVFLPRDASGAFALERATGKLVWENPFAPSDEAVGLLDGLLVAADRQVLAGLDVATGRARWRRHFPEGIRGGPCLLGTGLVVASGSGLQRLDAATGRLADSADWGAAGPTAAFAVRGRALLGVTAESVGSDDEPVGKPLSPQAPAVQPPVRLPLTRAWKLARPNPTLWTPPPEAKLEGKLFLVSQGVLECVRATAQGGIEWQRALQPGFQAMAWTDSSLLLIYERSVAALDTATGRLRWHTDVPFRIRQWQDAPPWLVLGEFTESARGKATGVLDTATGRLLWHREFRELGAGHGSYFHGIGWDGTSIHLLASLEHRHGGGHFDVVCAPADGRVSAVRRFLPKGREWPFLFDVAEGFGFYVDQDRVAWDFALDGSPHVRHSVSLRDLNAQAQRALRRTRTRRRLQKSEQWIQIHQYEDYPLFRHTVWILQVGNPSYELRRSRPGVIRGNTLFEVHDQSIRIVDLPGRKEVAELRLVLPPHRRARVLDYAEHGDAVLVVSGIERGPYDSAMVPYRVQVDAFERATGRHLASQLLDDVPYWRFIVRRDWRDQAQQQTQVAWGGGMLFLTDADGLIALAPAPAPAPAPEKPVHVGHHVGRTPVIDGWLDDWHPRQAIALGGQGAPPGSLYVAHDGGQLYLALAHAAAAAGARRGAGAYSDGDWLEVALTAGDHTRRFTLGADDRSRAAWAPDARLPDDARGAVRHDLGRQLMIYELALPLKGLVRMDSGDRWRRLRISVAAWRTVPGRQPERVLTWGNPWWGPTVLPEFHETVYLHPLTFEGEEAGLALAHELPELEEAWEFFQDSCELRARRRPSAGLAGLYREYLKRHPNGLPAERALLALDRALRGGLDADPSAEVLRIAQEVGVAQPVRARYARLVKSHLSLWLHTDPKKLPAGLMVEFHDGRERGGWDHRVAWGVDPWHEMGEPGTPSHQHAGPVPQADGWQELRIPLVWIDLQDKPLCGISFAQHGGGRVVWDRCALVYEGGERVFLDDEPPKAREVAGQWAWVAEPRKSGAKAHTDANPGGPTDTVHYHVVGFEAPVYEHLIPPATGAVLSQWVYLDPAKPPRTVALSLQARGDPYRLLWGQPSIEGRYMGPLPRPGQWHELRVPLAWTPYAAWPLRGFLFEQVGGGRVVWDHTAILTGGREHLLIEDEMPQGSSRNDWQWVEQPVKTGKKAHTQPPGEGHEAHGVLYLRQPVTQHIAFDAARMHLALQQHIPRLGPTGAAWRFFGVLRDVTSCLGRSSLDRMRWFLSVLPDHPQNLSLLKTLLDYAQEGGEPAPLAAMETLMEASALPRATRIAFRRQFGTAEPSFLRAWRVVGPFPNPKGAGHAKPYPPETDPVALDRDYAVIGGTARWRFHSSGADFVDLAKLFKPNEHVVAYAVCWVRSPKAQPVSLEVGSDDGVKLWLNRKPLLDHGEVRSSQPRQHSVPAELRAGWNEVLLKVDQATTDWGFHLELLDAEARGLVRAVQVSTTPPARAE
ncbi:MAG TPA: PQQ-binding-like beta-propeller repeat protein [Planctomycetota bacterium]|nr:PQQ-binding-like beta-propeller repeat protein [Planctomycetota bacterium]